MVIAFTFRCFTEGIQYVEYVILKQTSDLLPSTIGMPDIWLYVAREFIAVSFKCLLLFRAFSLCFKKMLHAPMAPFTPKALLLIYQDEE